MGPDKFIELDVKKLEHIEAERKRLLATVMQENPDMHFMCCPRCSHALVEKTILNIHLVWCQQCGGIWIDKKVLAEIIKLSGETADDFLKQAKKTLDFK